MTLARGGWAELGPWRAAEKRVSCVLRDAKQASQQLFSRWRKQTRGIFPSFLASFFLPFVC